MRDALEPVIALAKDLPREELPRLLGDLEEDRTTALARLTALAVQVGPDELLDVEQASKRLGVSKDYLYRAHGRLPFTRRQGRKLLFSSSGSGFYLKKSR